VDILSDTFSPAKWEY